MSVEVTSLDSEGRGVARIERKVVFIDGALPGEWVDVEVWRRRPRFDFANLTRVERASPVRAAPRCPHYERCGGCSLQHVEPRAQVAMKQRTLEDDLARIGKVAPEILLAPVHGPNWGYRHRARMSVRMVYGKGGMVGFHERRTHRVVNMDSCDVLPPRVSAFIPSLRALITDLDLRARIPQVEIAVGEERIALCFRVLDPVSEHDAALFRGLAATLDVDLYVQSGGPGSERSLAGMTPTPLTYRLPEFDLQLSFGPTDFIQVNHAINQVLVRRAVALLDARPDEQIADFFCGLGNFTLAIARRGSSVIGVEGSSELVRAAQQNAILNGLSDRASFFAADLFKEHSAAIAQIGRIDRALIDPPRAGALELIQVLPALKKLVYVSCNPATLARDAGILVHEKGYRLEAAGVINMFPHTAHIESIAVFAHDSK